MSAKTNRSLFLILTATILLFLLLGCAPYASWWGNVLNRISRSGASVSGTAFITNNGKKSPVPNVDVSMSASEITIAKYSTTTDSNGHFEFKNVTPGTYYMRIAGGDLGWNDTITVNKNASLNLGEIPLRPTLPPPPGNNAPTLPGT